MIACSAQDDGEECDCPACREDAERERHHTCIYVGVDDHDECEICGRRSDQFAGLPEHMQPDWDGAA